MLASLFPHFPIKVCPSQENTETALVLSHVCLEAVRLDDGRC